MSKFSIFLSQFHLTKGTTAQLTYRHSKPYQTQQHVAEELPAFLGLKANSTFLHALKRTGNHLSLLYMSSLSSKVNVFPTNNALHV